MITDKRHNQIVKEVMDSYESQLSNAYEGKWACDKALQQSTIELQEVKREMAFAIECKEKANKAYNELYSQLEALLDTGATIQCTRNYFIVRISHGLRCDASVAHRLITTFPPSQYWKWFGEQQVLEKYYDHNSITKAPADIAAVREELQRHLDRAIAEEKYRKVIAPEV